VALRRSPARTFPRRDAAPSFLVCGLLAGPIFFAVSLTTGAVRSGYSALQHPVSSLELGTSGWVQSVNFLLVGVLVFVSGWGFLHPTRRLGGGRWGPILVMAVGVGLAGAGLFDPDPLNGYPPGSPLEPVHPSRHFMLHSAFSTPVFTAWPAVCFVYAVRWRRAGQRQWAAYSALSGGAMATLFVLTSVAFAQGSVLTPTAGLLQRLTLATGFAWLAALSWHFFRLYGGPSQEGALGDAPAPVDGQA
jgi:hypothetical protein